MLLETYLRVGDKTNTGKVPINSYFHFFILFLKRMLIETY